jgi:hypothetical protein
MDRPFLPEQLGWQMVQRAVRMVKIVVIEPFGRMRYHRFRRHPSTQIR